MLVSPLATSMSESESVFSNETQNDSSLYREQVANFDRFPKTRPRQLAKTGYYSTGTVRQLRLEGQEGSADW